MQKKSGRRKGMDNVKDDQNRMTSSAVQSKSQYLLTLQVSRYRLRECQPVLAHPKNGHLESVLRRI